MKHREIAEALAGLSQEEVGSLTEAADALRTSNSLLSGFETKKKRRGPKPGSKRASKEPTPALPVAKASKAPKAAAPKRRKSADAFPSDND